MSYRDEDSIPATFETDPANATVRVAGAASVLDLIGKQVRQKPAQIAIEYGDRRITYGELRRCSDEVATSLRALGIGPEAVVGVLGPASCQSLISIYGILKAGGAYLPIDANQPAARTEAILDETEATVCINAAGEIDVRSVPRDPGTVTAKGARRPPTAEDLAYIIYTSGSTGKPNGVMVTHGNLLHSTLARLAYYGKPVGRFLLLSPLTFDSSVAGIFWSLTTGGTLVLPYPNLARQLQDLPATIRQTRTTHLLCIPSLWQCLLTSNRGSPDFGDLKTVIVAGEACTPAVAAGHFHVCPHVELYNEYGPTEATVWSTAYRITSDRSMIPIGAPIENTRVYVLDEQLRPVAPGQPGELCVAGRGVARGYLKRPETTLQRFLANPFTNGPYARMYRTGDRVKQEPDGNLVFCGRIDEQIKLRGHRLDPAEVESHLACHAGVKESVVFLRNAALHALFVAAEAPGPSPSDLRDYLARILPAYMVPTDVQAVPDLPRTAHGKIDRRALEQTTIATVKHAAHDAAAFNALATVQNQIELELMRFWQQLLEKNNVSRQDNFFQIGGDSLAAIGLMSFVKERFARDLRLSELLDHPTIGSLARLIQEAAEPASWSPLVPLQPTGSRQPLFMVHPGGGNVLCYLELARHLGDDQPLYGLQAPGVDGIRAPVASIGKLAEEYMAAMRTVQPRGPYAIGGWSFGGLVAYEIAVRLQEAGEIASTLAIVDAGILYSVHVLRQLFRDENVPLFHLLGAPEDVLLPHFRGPAARAGLLAANASEEQALHFLRVFRSNAAATIEFRPRRYKGQMLLVRGRDEPATRKTNPINEWQPHCDRIIVERTSGEHLTLFRSPHVAQLAQVLTQQLTQ